MLDELVKEITNVKNAGQRMSEVAGEVRKIQDIFRNPKQRGRMGEISLERLLGEILPAESFQMQYQFRNNKLADALIKMPDYIVAVDAKFPLPSFEAILTAENDNERTRARRQFLRDVSAHIDKIAESYILPAEGTLDFAFMYIPAENVYYETVIKYGEDKIDLLDYAHGKKVIPVSPNLFYVYLMTVVMGLRGLRIEKQAARIRQDLSKLSAGLTEFGDKWNILGKHIRNAQNQYDEADKKLGRFADQLNRIQSTGDDNEV